MIAWIAACLLSVLPADVSAAQADYAAQPPLDQLHTRYVSTSEVPEDRRDALATTLCFVAPSVSRALVLDHQIPQRVTPTLWRINLRRLAWAHQDWLHCVSANPYHVSPNPLIVRADWLVVRLTDASESDVYYRLLFGRVPKTRDEFLQLVGVSKAANKGLAFGLIEGDSGISRQRVRLLQHFDRVQGFAWGTRDVRDLGQNDPLEQLDGGRHDAEEWIVGLPKVSLVGRSRGLLQVYLLADGAGRRVDEAPVKIVEDHSRFRGVASVRTAGSCIQCHAAGVILPTVNALERTLASGVDLYTTDPAEQERLEAFFLTGAATELARNQQDFAAGVRACNGLAPAENGARFRAVVDAYTADVAPEQAARELDCTLAELTAALGYASAGQVKLGVRLAGLAHGQAVPRQAWEADYLKAAAALKVWRTAK